jgi:acetylornithine deacetylase
METRDILEKLIGFPTVSRESNLQLIDFVRDTLGQLGIAAHIVHSADGRKANLYATVGPGDRSGIMLSGHSDVVPVDGQDWTLPPFVMTERDGKMYGRGAADMKGFIACAVAAMMRASRLSLQVPLHLALSYDEEIGCVGVRSLIEYLRSSSPKPFLCIVGEPTSMQLATGHKGKIAARATCRGQEGHSALAPRHRNALHLGCDFVDLLRREQECLAAAGEQDESYEIPYTTVHVGKMNGGVALNMVPNLCQIDFEIRNIEADDAEKIFNRLRQGAHQIANKTKPAAANENAIELAIVNAYPGLDTPLTSDAVKFVRSLIGGNSTTKLAFGTEGGLFNRDLGIPTVICGPGSMDQGHKPDEFVSCDQLQQCDEMLARLLQKASDLAQV